MQFLVFILAVYGLTMILVEGKIFTRLRGAVTGAVEPIWWLSWIADLITCPVCMALWVGLVLCCLSDWTPLIPNVTGLPDYVILAGAASGCTWLLDSLVNWLNPV